MFKKSRSKKAGEVVSDAIATLANKPQKKSSKKKYVAAGAAAAAILSVLGAFVKDKERHQ